MVRLSSRIAQSNSLSCNFGIYNYKKFRVDDHVFMQFWCGLEIIVESSQRMTLFSWLQSLHELLRVLRFHVLLVFTADINWFPI